MSERTGSLQRLFQDSAGSGAKAPPSEAELSASLAEARSAWPTMKLAEEVVVPYWAKRCHTSLAKLQTADLFLACACSGGDEAAIRAFEKAYFGDLSAAISQIDSKRSFREESLQALREHLFVGSRARPPRITSYGGAGALYSWTRVVAIRLALAAKNKETREVHLDQVPIDELVEPHLAQLKRAYRSKFSAAFADAVANLEPRKRTLLRLHLVDGLSIDKLGDLYGVHRATVARWLSSLRDRIASETKARLKDDLGLADPAEVESVLRLIASRVELSLRTQLLPRDDS